MNNKFVWVVIGTLLAIFPLGVLLIPVAEGYVGFGELMKGNWKGILSLTWIPIGLSCFAFYMALQSDNPED